MIESSKTFTFLVMDAPGVDPKLLELPVPLGEDAIVAAIHEAIPDPPPRVDDFANYSGLVFDDGSSLGCVPSYRLPCANAPKTNFYRCSSISLLCPPQSYDYPFAQHGYIDYDFPYSPATFSSSSYPPSISSPSLCSPTTVASSLDSPTASAPSPSSPSAFASSPDPNPSRVLIEGSCVGAKLIEQKGRGYICSSCNRLIKRRDDAKRHIRTAGMKVSCKYCGKPSSRPDSRARHLSKNKACRKAWEIGFKKGRFTERSVEDAYN